MRPLRNSLVLAVAFVVAVSLLDGPSLVVQAQKPMRGHAVPRQMGQTVSTYTLYCGLWRVDNGFVSTLHIKNALIVAALSVTPVLFMADGTEYDLPDVQLATGGTGNVNVNGALAKAPASIA